MATVIPTLSLENADGETYTFPKDFWIEDDSWTTAKEIKRRPFHTGGKNVADGFTGPRIISVNGALRADNLTDLETIKRALMVVLNQGVLKLRVSDDTVSRYIEVSLPDVGSAFQGDYRLEIPVSISFLALDTVWKDSVETEDINILAGDGTFTVDGLGSDLVLWPIIQIDADQAVDVPSVFIKNLNDGGMSFTYNNPGFLTGMTLIIDSGLGTVKLNNSNSIAFFNPGRFLRLQNIVNNFSYEGAACTITVKFRKVYF